MLTNTLKAASIILIIMTTGCIAETGSPEDDDAGADVDADADAEACHKPPCLVGPITCETDDDCGIGACDPERLICVSPE